MPPTQPHRRGAGPTGASSLAPDPSSFLNPWDHGCLIRYLAFLRQVLGSLPTPMAGLREAPALDDVFVQPRLSPLSGGKLPAGRSTLDLFDLLDQHRQIVISGERGSGRSTLVAWLAHALSEPTRNPTLDRLGRMVPLWFPLRRMGVGTPGRTVEALFALHHGRPWWYRGMDEVLPALLERGQILFLIDGYDELEDVEAREALRDAILDGVWRFPSCTFLITATPAGLDAVPLREEGPDTGALPLSLQALPAPEPLELPVWALAPFDVGQVKAWTDRWASLFGGNVDGQVAAAEALFRALDASPELHAQSRLPGWLPLLAAAWTRQGRLGQEGPALREQMVVAAETLLSQGPWSGAVRPPHLRRWLLSLADEAERGRPRSRLGAALASLRAVCPEDPGEAVAATILEAAIDRLPFLDATDRSLGFSDLELRRHLAARRVTDLLHAGQVGPAAVDALKSWAREADGAGHLARVIGQLAEQPEAAERVYNAVLGDGRPHTLTEADELGPLALALAQAGDKVPLAVRESAGKLIEDSVMRWARDRGRVPRWTQDLTPVSALPRLQHLDISGCAALSDLRPLGHLTRLTRLDLHDCARVTDISPLAEVRNLTWLDARRCLGVVGIDPIGELAELTWLDLGGCEGIVDLFPLSRLRALQALALHGCENLVDLSPLAGLRNLRALVISGCPLLDDLSPLRHLPPGGTLWLKGSGVTRVPAGLKWNVIGLGGS